MEFVYNDMSAQASMAQYINDCVDVPRIIKGCQGCKNYAKLWSCPPFGFDPVKIWRDYSKLTLYARKISFPKDITEKTFAADGLTAQYFEIWNKERRRFFIKLMERNRVHRVALCLPRAAATNAQRAHGQTARRA